MKHRILSLLTWLALAGAAAAQTSTLTINTSTGLVNIPAGSATPNFAALKIGTVSVTLPTGALVGTSDTQALTGKTYNGITATSGTNTFTLTVGTASITLPAGVTGSIGSAAFLTPSANVITLLGSADYAAFRQSLGLPSVIQERTTEFATTSASAADLEMIFTNVPVTSGKTYTFEVEFWVKWATGATSGNATIASSCASPAHPTLGDNRMVAFMGHAVVASGSDTVDSTNANMVAAANWQRYRATGMFTATESENFNWGITVPMWDSGDVVTIKRGAILKVRQVD